MTALLNLFLGSGAKGPLVATASPSTLDGSGATATRVTPPATASVVSGGYGSYTYAWDITLDGGSITITSPTSATTTFTATLMTVGQIRTGTAYCTITDTVTGRTAATGNVGITIERTS